MIIMGGDLMDTRKRVEELCAERGVTPSAVAKMAGLNRSTFASAKNRSGQLSVGTIELFCEALDIPLWYFFDVQGCRKAET